MLPLVAVLIAAQPPDPAKALEERMIRAIDGAERGVAAVVVSHRKYQPEPSADKPWQLGRFEPFPGVRGFGGRFARQPSTNPLDLSDPQAAADNTFGSGLILSADGLVLTTHHLIDGATKVFVRTAGGGGSYADVHAADARSDLAVLKLIDPPDGLAPVRFADVRLGRGPRGETPTVRRGQWVIALGHPLAAGFADGAPSASWGILSNVRRRLAGTGPPGGDNRTRPLASYTTLLQTDARVTLGCSGGGLFTLDGEAVGLTSTAAGVTGAETAGGYAVPFDANVRRVVGVLAEGREVEYGFLGVSLDRGFGGERALTGVTVGTVTPGMPAERAGLRKDDRIVAIDDQPVAGTDDLFLNVGAALAGAGVRVGYVRNGERRETKAVLAKHSHDQPWVASRKRPAAFGLRPDWSSVLVVDKGGVEAGVPAGVLVREVEAGSPAEGKLKPFGDVVNRWLVTAVDGRAVTTPDEFQAAVADKPAVRLTLLDPTRPERPQEVTLP